VKAEACPIHTNFLKKKHVSFGKTHHCRMMDLEQNIFTMQAVVEVSLAWTRTTCIVLPIGSFVEIVQFWFQ